MTIAQASHSIRRLNPADATAYRALRLRALQEHPEAFTSSFEEEEAKPLHWSLERLNTPNARFWGAFSAAATARTQTQLQGMIGLQSETRQQNRHKATVVGMYVAPEVARQGLAKALLKAVLDQAKADRLRLLVLTVTESNAAARTLYVGAGFRTFGVEPQAVCIGGQFHNKEHLFLLL